MKIIKYIALSSFIISAQASAIKCPLYEKININKDIISKNIQLRKSDYKFQYDYYTFYPQTINKQKWMVMIGYSNQPDNSKQSINDAITELSDAFTYHHTLPLLHPITAEVDGDESYCMYKLNDNGWTGYADNYVALEVVK